MPARRAANSRAPFTSQSRPATLPSGALAERDRPEKVCVSLFGTALDASRRVEREDTDHDHHSDADAHHARSQAACSVAAY